jgi:hypothetical protein
VVLGACTVEVGGLGIGVVAGTDGLRVVAGGAACTGAVGRPVTSGTVFTVEGALVGDTVAVVVAAELPTPVEPSDDDGDEVCFSLAADARFTVSAADARAATPTHPAVIRRTLWRRASLPADPAIVDFRGTGANLSCDGDRRWSISMLGDKDQRNLGTVMSKEFTEMTQNRRTVVRSTFTHLRPARSSAIRVMAVISAIAWVWSWYTMYLEIHRWKHVTRTFRFNPPPPIPGTTIAPRPGLPLRALFVCAAAAPVMFAATVGGAIARRRRQAGRPSGSIKGR